MKASQAGIQSQDKLPGRSKISYQPLDGSQARAKSRGMPPGTYKEVKEEPISVQNKSDTGPRQRVVVARYSIRARTNHKPSPGRNTPTTKSFTKRLILKKTGFLGLRLLPLESTLGG